MPQAVCTDALAEGLRDVAASVVGQQALDRDAVAFAEGQSALQEGGRRGAAFVAELLGIGQACGVIDGHVGVVPADAAMLVAVAPAVDALAAAGPDAAQLLGVDEVSLALGCDMRASLSVPGLDTNKPTRWSPHLSTTL
jgi:hypothetical protein